MNVDVIYGSRVVKVQVALEKRRRLSITVHPDCRVTAKAPEELPQEKIAQGIQKRAKWIAAQLSFFEEYQPAPPPKQYVNGETHTYLGRQYRLRIQKGEKEQVRLVGRYFELELPQPADREQAEKIMKAWYGRHARQILENRLEVYLPRFRSRGASDPQVLYRRMKKRWGSCSRNGVVMLNTELGRTPLNCIDYVIVHELCHLLHPHHDKAFFRLLKKILPDWEKRKERLEKALF